jgi:hypothetical protein
MFMTTEQSHPAPNQPVLVTSYVVLTLEELTGKK